MAALVVSDLFIESAQRFQGKRSHERRASSLVMHRGAFNCLYLHLFTLFARFITSLVEPSVNLNRGDARKERLEKRRLSKLFSFLLL
jgi:hypothetical protein